MLKKIIATALLSAGLQLSAVEIVGSDYPTEISENSRFTVNVKITGLEQDQVIKVTALAQRADGSKAKYIGSGKTTVTGETSHIKVPVRIKKFGGANTAFFKFTVYNNDETETIKRRYSKIVTLTGVTPSTNIDNYKATIKKSTPLGSSRNKKQAAKEKNEQTEKEVSKQTPPVIADSDKTNNLSELGINFD